MKITDVKTCFKIADVEYIPNSTKLKFNYLNKIKNENGISLPKSILTKNFARVYIIVVDGVIKKIGGSQAEGGIKQTLAIYQDGGINGRPSIRSFGIWFFLYHTILENKKIEFFMIYQDNFKKEIKGLFGTSSVSNAYISYKLIEKACICDYLNYNNGKYPDWNIQEEGMDWPTEIKIEHAKILEKSSKKQKKITRKEAKR